MLQLLLLILFSTFLSLDSNHDASRVGRAQKFSSSIAACLQSVGHSMPCDNNVVRTIGVAAVVEALCEHLQGTHNHALHCPRATLSLRFLAARTIIALDLLASVGNTVSYLFLVDEFSAFYNSSMVLSNCLLMLIGF